MAVTDPLQFRDDLLASIYEEINENMRASDTKRDQVIASYIVVLGATIAAWKDLPQWRELIAATTALFGLATFVVATQYRRWHWIYSTSISTYQRVRSTKDALTLATFRNAWNASRDPVSVWRLMDPREGVEIVMTYLLAFLSFVPVYLLMTENGWGLASPVSGDLPPFLVDAVLYALALSYLSSRFAKRFRSFATVENSWMYRWLKEPPAASGSGSQSSSKGILRRLNAILDPHVE